MIPGAIALVVAAVLGAAARALGPRIGAVDVPAGELKPHPQPVSYLGGMTVALAIVAGLIARGWPLRLAGALGLAGALILGLVDDAIDLTPLSRLALQAALAVGVVAGGLRADALPGAVLAWVAAIVLFVVAMNGVNLVDGMDGLAAGAVVISTAGLAAIARSNGGGTGLALVTSGAAAGFLFYNLPPARLFLGDGGAYLLGVVLAVSILHAGGSAESLAGAATCLGLFALDPALAILRRRVNRLRLTEGDRGHLYDQLAARGLGPVACLAASWGAHTALVVAGIVAASLPTAAGVVFSVGVWAASIFALFSFGFVSYGPTP
ncbi:MAG: undecaprenyl/decaprenyl-phosphate alpha-N-acetylglucosaminyl 1-phosphate transferase [Actinomycetota bacterium]|nr:undecaprenyl/decaprenyl-phosphate alpha-N-acetylglucosaminyl 1-phosphate transferase [Actinomycetota bacterium]